MSNSGAGDIAEAQDKDFDVLAGGVEHLRHRQVGEQAAEGGEIDAIRHGVDHCHLAFAGNLHHDTAPASRCARA